jgi:alkaline phosphatase D
MWDDHEVTNNEWMSGAEDHQPGLEGPYAVRLAAAVQAYHEWLPTREPTGDKAAYNRTVHFGDVASITVLETRLTARTDPNANPAGNVFANVTKEIAHSADHSVPAKWPGSDLERRLLAIKRELDVYREREDKEILGHGQLQWVGESTRWGPCTS